MGTPITPALVEALKFELRLLLPSVSSRDRLEAMARGFGWRTYAALKADLREDEPVREIDDDAFVTYLQRYELRQRTGILERAVDYATETPGVMLRHENGKAVRASLVDPVDERSLFSSFLAVDAPIVEFRRTTEDRDAVFIRIAPFAGTPVLLKVDMHGELGADAYYHPILREVRAVGSSYSWDTDSYRHVCHAMGLDPDHGRPPERHLLEADRQAMQDLSFATASGGGEDRIFFGIWIHHGLQLFAGERLDNWLLDETLEKARAFAAGEDTPPTGCKIDAAVFERFCRVLSNFEPEETPRSTIIEFLPSPDGTGYYARVEGGRTRGKGWWCELDIEVGQSIAIRPEEAVEGTFEEFVVSWLEDRGVRFVEPSEAEAYRATQNVFEGGLLARLTRRLPAFLRPTGMRMGR